MRYLNNKTLTPTARELRKYMTVEERKLWYGFLKNLPVNVYRQKVIGRFIVDFYIASLKIVIEVDGKNHLSKNQIAKDNTRDVFFNRLGIIVLRYSNESINYNFKKVCDDIKNHLNQI